LKRNEISYNKFIKLQAFYYCFCWRFGNRCWHRQEVTQHDVRAYTWSTSKSTATEQNKSAVTDHAISLKYVIDWDHAKVIDRKSNRMDRWIREAIHIRKKQDKSMNRDEGSYQLPHIYDYLLSAAATPGGQSFGRWQQQLPKHQQKQ